VKAGRGKPVPGGLGPAANAKVALSIDRGRLAGESRPRPKFSLAEIMAQDDPAGPENEDERAWQDIEPVGREIL
jgi:antitoxin ChpS